MNNVRKVIVGLLAAVMLGASASAVAVTHATTATVNTAYNSSGTGTSVGGVTGGSVYNVSIAATGSTGKWAGIFGNVSSVSLSLNPTSATQAFYSWSLTPTNNSLILATTNSSPNWSTLANGVVANVDTAWSYTGADTDSAASTFSGSSGVTIGGTSKTTATVLTYTSTGAQLWKTHIVNLVAAASTKPYLVFAGNYTLGTSGITAYDGSYKQYQMLVPDNNDNGASSGTTYYMFVQV